MRAENILILGLNHKTAPVAIREKLAFSGDSPLPLKELLAVDGCTECCMLSTCNRVEVISVCKDPEQTGKDFRKFL